MPLKLDNHINITRKVRFVAEGKLAYGTLRIESTDEDGSKWVKYVDLKPDLDSWVCIDSGREIS